MKYVTRGFLGFLLFLFVGSVGTFLWLRTSLPQLDGALPIRGLSDKITLERGQEGILTIRAKSLSDAYAGLGFAHAQDRLAQMELMRRFGSGRLSELLGERTLAADKLSRLLGLRRMAEAQWRQASPGLIQALSSYSAGVNAYLHQRRDALPLDLLLLNPKLQIEDWSPIDSLLWGRIMALRLTGNRYEEQLNRQLKAILPPDIFAIIAAEPTKGASNNWVLSAAISKSGKPLLANDPHLELSAPSPWYLARLVTDEGERLGATAPGLPFTIIGSNGHVAWGFTTTASDCQDLFEEKPAQDSADYYLTPTGIEPFFAWQEIIKVKSEKRAFIFRRSRHGPIISDLGNTSGEVLALSWSAFTDNDRTAEALLSMNRADNAAAFSRALQDFHSPQQNIVFADKDGKIGFVAAGRVPIRKALYAKGELPAPGETGEYDWVGWIPFEQLPQGYDSPYFATANNKIIDDDYPFFIAAKWENNYRIERIRELLNDKPSFDLNDMKAIQLDILSPAAREFVPMLIPIASPEIARLLRNWDYRMDANKPQPALFTAWLNRWSNLLLSSSMGPLFHRWFFWQITELKEIAANCHCPEKMNQALESAVAELKNQLGRDPNQWRWGDLHVMHFAHPILGQLPIIGQIFHQRLPASGDNFTLNRAAPNPDTYEDIHGPTLRFLVDMADPQHALFAVAGGQSGNPFSRYYSNLLEYWHQGKYLSMLGPAQHVLVLEPR